MRNLALVSVPLALLFFGCSDDGGGGEGEGSGSTGPGTETSADGTDGTNGSADGTDGSGDETSAGTSTSGADTGPGDETDSGTESGSGDECREDSDCVLVNDCCNCAAAPVGGEPPCDVEACLQNTCDAMGLMNPAVRCDEGTCELAPISCDESLVTCDSTPPDCPPGYSPGVDEEASCWSGACVANTICDPSCGDCTETQACVRYAAGGPPDFQCVDIPEGCDGTPTCECMGGIACTDPFNACNEIPQGLECACPAC